MGCFLFESTRFLRGISARRVGRKKGSRKNSGLETQWVGENMLLRLSTVNEYRAPVVFMLGGGSSYMTGADLRADGGHCAW